MGPPVCGPATPFTAVPPSGWRTVANLQEKLSHHCFPESFGAAGLRSGSPVHGCATIGLAHSRKLAGEASFIIASPNLLGPPVCGPAAPFTAVPPSGWRTVANLSVAISCYLAKPSGRYAYSCHRSACEQARLVQLKSKPSSSSGPRLRTFSPRRQANFSSPVASCGRDLRFSCVAFHRSLSGKSQQVLL